MIISFISLPFGRDFLFKVSYSHCSTYSTYYFISWGDDVEDRIYGSRVSTSGIVIDSTGIIITDNLTYSDVRACLTSDGTNYLVTWWNRGPLWNEVKRGVFGSRINQNGEILDTIDINTSYELFGMPGSTAALAFDGNNYLFVGHKPLSIADLIGKRISQSGVVIDTISMFGGCAPSISFNDDHYLVSFLHDSWGGDYNVYARRIDTSGVLLDSTDIQITQYPIPCNYMAYDPTIAFDGTNSLVIWNILAGATYSVMIEGSRVDKNGNVLDPDGIIISTNPNSQFSPSVTSDGPNYFIVWKDTRYDIFDIYGTRIDQQGNNLNPNGIRIHKGYEDERNDPKVTFGGSYYMAVWIGYEPQRNICRARIDQSGILMDTSSVAIIISGIEARPSIASDGDKYLVAIEVNPQDKIYGLILDQSGTVMNTFPISITAGDKHSPQIAFNGSNYLVFWSNQPSGPNNVDIYGTLVGRSGGVLQPDGIQICIDEGCQVYPSAASDGKNYLVVWQDNIDPPTNIWGARLDSSGTLMDTVAFPISLAQGNQEKPVVAFNGSDYVVVWQDNRNGIDYDIYGARVNREGNVIDSFVVSKAIGDQLSPDVAYSSRNQVLVVYSGWTGEYEGKRYDCMRIWGKYMESVTSIDEQLTSEIVTEYKLMQCYPNPFNSFTTIQYSIKERSSVELVLYDILGSQVVVLVNEEQDAGYYKIDFNAGRLASGIYFYRLQAGSFVETKKMVLLR